MNLAFWKKPKTPPVTPVKIPSTKLRLSEWRSNESLVHAAQAALKNDYLQSMLDVLRTEHPANFELPIGSRLDVRAAWQARCEGYTAAISNLESMGNPIKKEEPVVSVFEAEEQPTEKES